MQAFVEHLSGVVRAGPDCDRYGKPFDCAVAYSSVDGRTAVVKALTSRGGVTVAHDRAVIRALEDIGLSATWERVRS
jgi:hypothetical protein